MVKQKTPRKKSYSFDFPFERAPERITYWIFYKCIVDIRVSCIPYLLLLLLLLLLFLLLGVSFFVCLFVVFLNMYTVNSI